MKKVELQQIVVEDIAIGEKVDIIAILGRAATGVRFVNTTSSTTEAFLVINSLKKVNKEEKETVDGEINFWPVFDFATPSTYSAYASCTLGENEEISTLGSFYESLSLTSIEVGGLTSLETGSLVLW